MLTLQQLKDMKPGRFATGTGYHPEIIHKDIRWVAVRGEGYHDWAIYYLHVYANIEDVMTNGDKMFTESVIKRLVPCDDKAFKMYRL
jgi:hypothetical protein